MKEDMSFNTKKHEAITIAKELCYPSVIINKLKNATNEIQLYNIMKDGRNMM